MSHFTVLAVFDEEPKNLELAVTKAMAPFEEGVGVYQKWDYWMIDDFDGKPRWRGRVRDYGNETYLYALIDPDGYWVQWDDGLSETLKEYGDHYAVEIDAHC